MCRNLFGRKEPEKPLDPKMIKESCCAVKEAAQLVSGLGKGGEVQEQIKVVFENTEEYSE